MWPAESPCKALPFSLTQSSQFSISWFSVFLTSRQGEAAAHQSTATTTALLLHKANFLSSLPLEEHRPSGDCQLCPCLENRPLGPQHTSGTQGALARHPGHRDTVTEASQAWQIAHCLLGLSRLIAELLLPSAVTAFQLKV